MGEGRHLVLDEAAHLGAHLLERVVEAAVADGESALCRGHQLGQPGPCGARIAMPHQHARTAAMQYGSILRFEPEVGEAGELLLVHRDAAGDLAQVFADRDLDQQLLGLAQAAFPCQPLGIFGKDTHDLDIGGEPGERVEVVLLGVEALGRDAADGGTGSGQNLAGRRARLPHMVEQPVDHRRPASPDFCQAHASPLSWADYSSGP